MTSIPAREPSRNNDSRLEFKLGRLRCAALESRLDANAIDTIGVGLKGGFLSFEVADEWLHEIGRDDLVGDGAAR